NGAVFYSTPVPSTARLRADTSFYSPGATLQNVVISSGGAAPAPVTWVNDVNVVQGPLTSGVAPRFADVDGDGRADEVLSAADGRLWVRRGNPDATFGDASAQSLGANVAGFLRKTATGAIWGDAGASSIQTMAGAGYVETMVAETNTHRMIALSRVDGDAGYTSLEYALYLSADGTFYVFESGVNRGQVGPYAIGDVLRIERQADGHVVYKKNGNLFYTSPTSSTGTLRVDSSHYTQGATLQAVVVSSGRTAAVPVQWTNEVGVEHGHLAPTGSTSLADVTGDGRADAILAAADGRLWVRQARADGSLGDAVGQGLGLNGLNVLRKTSGTFAWDSGASSAQSLA